MVGVRFVGEDFIVPFGLSWKKIWGFMSVGLSDGVVGLGEDAAKSLAVRLKEDPFGTVYVAVKRTPVKGLDGFKEEMLILTPSELAVPALAEHFSQLSGEELARQFLRFFAYIPAYTLKGKSVERPYSSVPADRFYEPPPESFYRDAFLNEIERRRKEGNRIRVFKGLFPVKKPEMFRLFAGKWSGLLLLRFLFHGRLLESLARSRGGIFGGRKEDRPSWIEFADAIKTNAALVCTVESTLYLDSPYGEKEAGLVLRGALGQEPLEWFYSYRSLIEDSIAIADDVFEHFYAGDGDTADKFGLYSFGELFPVKLGKTYEPPEVQVFGVNRDGNYRCYHFFREGNIPSVGVIAPPRSGKSFFTQGVVCQFSGIPVEELYEGKFSGPLEAFVCYFDVGYSAEFLVRLLKLRGVDCEVVVPDESVKINPFEVDDAYDAEVSTKVINLLFEIRGEKPLTAAEEGILKKTLLTLAKERAYLDSFQLNLLEVKEDKAFRELYNRAIELGYDPFTPFSQLKEKEFAPLKYPTVVTVLRFLETLRSVVGKDEAEIIDGLQRKLREISKIPNFSDWSTFTFTKREFVYFELSKIKESTNFAPIYLLLFLKALKAMRKVDPQKPKLFINDEFHNITRYSQFKTLFEVLLREAPKFNIYTFMITQEPKDLDGLTNLIGTKILFKPAPEVEGAVGEETTFELDAKEVFHLSDRAYAELRTLPRYTPLVVSASGFFTLRLPVREAEALVFESRKHTEIVTPDGHRICKSYVEEVEK